MKIPEYGDMCWNCAFYQHRIDPAGECHRTSPVTYHGDSESEFDELAGVWPTVDADDWCGEHRLAPMSRLRERDHIERVIQERSSSATTAARINFRAHVADRVIKFSDLTDDQ